MTDTTDNFQITSYLEIRALLRSIGEQGALIRMFIQGRSLALVTALLDIDDDTQSFIVDNSADDDFNRRLVAADTVTFETTLNKIRIVFASGQAQHCIHGDRPALRLPFPESMRRIQRREYYRVDLPVATSAPCVIPGRPPITLQIKDIGAGGVSLIDDKQGLNPTAGTVYTGCQLELADTGTVIIDLEVRRSHDETLSNGKKVRVIGCRFIDLPNSMHILVQNFIGRLERKLSARLRGFD